MKLFREIFFICKIHKKTLVPESHFNNVTGLYPATSLKERTPTQVFSDEFCEILKTPVFYRTPPGDCFCSTEKIRKRKKNEKTKKMETACKKSSHTDKAKTYYYLHKVFISFYYSKISLFLFPCFPWYIENTSF